MSTPDFWPSCGYRLLRVTPEGTLAVTDDFLRSLLLRPELAPVADSSPAELALHERLIADPRATIPAQDIAAVADADVAHNYEVWLRFRDRLLQSETLEAAYMALFRDGVDVPPLFVHQLTQILLRHILRERGDAMEIRAAEMLFRTQKIAVLPDGAVMAADADTVEAQAISGSFSSLSELLRHGGPPQRTVDLDVLNENNAAEYWSRDERYDLSLSLNRGRPGLAALMRVLELWVAHFLDVRVSIKAQREIDDRRWVWHVGLDAEASAMLNDLYNRQDVSEERLKRLLCLFELAFDNPADMRPAIAGRPVYLAMAMDSEEHLRLKPQNLLMNLPLAAKQ
ncbi:MAG TPA: DUF6352 family protein [Casimicrobiaceae bacterium]|nr:DUF6352 family protein [Casimicrobiaceae bacterium]